MPNVTIATANTYLGNMLKDSRGLEQFNDVDILMLQEIDPVADQMEELVSGHGFQVAHTEVGTGLAILHRPTVELIDSRRTLLQVTPAYQRWILQNFREHPLQTVGRGTLQATFETTSGDRVTAVTAHANVPVKPIRRMKYVRMLPGVMGDIDGPAVLAGDMNHWPGPQAVDLRMGQSAGLERVDIGDEPTYTSANSKHAWIGKVTRIAIDGQFDAMLYTPEHLQPVTTEVRDIASDHRAIVTEFEFS